MFILLTFVFLLPKVEGTWHIAGIQLCVELMSLINNTHIHMVPQENCCFIQGIVLCISVFLTCYSVLPSFYYLSTFFIVFLGQYIIVLLCISENLSYQPLPESLSLCFCSFSLALISAFMNISAPILFFRICSCHFDLMFFSLCVGCDDHGWPSL